MGLDEAIQVLCKVHTQDDSQAGFCVRMGATPDPLDFNGPLERYTEAWRVLRARGCLPTKPEHYK